jgi:hypothetical protein
VHAEYVPQLQLLARNPQHRDIALAFLQELGVSPESLEGKRELTPSDREELERAFSGWKGPQNHDITAPQRRALERLGIGYSVVGKFGGHLVLSYDGKTENFADDVPTKKIVAQIARLYEGHSTHQQPASRALALQAS